MSAFILGWSIFWGLLFILAICKAARECAKPSTIDFDFTTRSKPRPPSRPSVPLAGSASAAGTVSQTPARGAAVRAPLSPRPGLVSSLAPPRRGFTILRRLRPFAGLLK